MANRRSETLPPPADHQRLREAMFADEVRLRTEEIKRSRTTFMFGHGPLDLEGDNSIASERPTAPPHDGGAQAVLVTDEIHTQLLRWFGADATGYFERTGRELTANYLGCTGRHQNPREAPVRPENLPRPSLPRVEQLFSTVVGSQVLQVALPQPYGNTCPRPSRRLARPGPFSHRQGAAQHHPRSALLDAGRATARPS